MWFIFNRYPAICNVPEKKLKKEAKRIEITEEDIKPCIIQLTHQMSKRGRGLEPLPCNGSASTHTATSRRLLAASITERFLKFELREKTNEKKRSNDTNGLQPARTWSRAAGFSATPTANYYSASDWTFWPIHGPGVGYLLRSICKTGIFSVKNCNLWSCNCLSAMFWKLRRFLPPNLFRASWYT